MTNLTTEDFMKSVLMAAGSAINDARSTLPIGCTGKMENGVFKADSIMNITSLQYDVEASDGFIIDGLLVVCTPNNRFVKPKKAEQRWRKAIFTLSGSDSGSYGIFVRSEYDYKSYMNRSLWNIEKHEVEFRHLDGNDADTKTRVIKVPTIFNSDSGVYECKDRNYLVENKVSYLLSTRAFEDYEAYLDGKVFDAEIKMFVTIDDNGDVTDEITKAE